MTSTGSPTTQDDRSFTPGGAFASILNAAVGFAAGKLERRVAAWTDKLQGVATGDSSSGDLTALADVGLDELAEDGTVGQKAGAEGVKAGLHGGNPVWAAIRATWQSGTPVVRAAVVAGAVSVILLLLLSPVVLLVFLLSLLIIVIIQRARAAQK